MPFTCLLGGRGSFLESGFCPRKDREPVLRRFSASAVFLARSLPGRGCPSSAVWLALLCNDQGVPHGKQRGSLCLWNPRSSLRAASLVKSNKQNTSIREIIGYNLMASEMSKAGICKQRCQAEFQPTLVCLEAGVQGKLKKKASACALTACLWASALGLL